MSRISENIRKITRAWGGKTTGNGISDAVRDLAENLPFGTKTEMVEILPEQSITGSYDDDGGSATPMYNADTGVSVDIKANKVYDVYFNDKKYTCTGFDMGDTVALGNVNVMGDTGMADNGEPFCLVTAPSMDGGESTLMCGWDTTEGETITLAIYEEQEVVTPLPAMFMPEPIIFTTTDMRTATCNKSYEECAEALKNYGKPCLKMDSGDGSITYMYCMQSTVCEAETGEYIGCVSTLGEISISVEWSKFTGEILINVLGAE